MTEIETRAVELKSGEVVLRGEFLIPEAGVPLVVLCHGIPLSRPDPADPGYAGLARRLAESGYAALFVNFRGTGESSGNFCMGGWYEDLDAVMEYAREALADGFAALYIAGFSAGGALAVRYAAEAGGVDGVAVFAAPARLTQVFPRTYCMTFLELAREIGIIKDLRFPPTPDWFYDDMERHDAIDFIGEVSPTPLLIVHGDADETVPVEQGRELFEAAGQPKELSILPGGAHRLRHDPRAPECLLNWLARRR